MLTPVWNEVITGWAFFFFFKEGCHGFNKLRLIDMMIKEFILVAFGSIFPSKN